MANVAVGKIVLANSTVVLQIQLYFYLAFLCIYIKPQSTQSKTYIDEHVSTMEMVAYILYIGHILNLL